MVAAHRGTADGPQRCHSLTKEMNPWPGLAVGVKMAVAGAGTRRQPVPVITNVAVALCRVGSMVHWRRHDHVPPCLLHTFRWIRRERRASGRGAPAAETQSTKQQGVSGLCSMLRGQRKESQPSRRWGECRLGSARLGSARCFRRCGFLLPRPRSRPRHGHGHATVFACLRQAQCVAWGLGKGRTIVSHPVSAGCCPCRADHFESSQQQSNDDGLVRLESGLVDPTRVVGRRSAPFLLFRLCMRGWVRKRRPAMEEGRRSLPFSGTRTLISSKQRGYFFF